MTTTDSVPHTEGALVARSVTALKWNYAGAAARVLSQLMVGIVLARLLGPEPFGLIAIAWIVVGFCNLVSDVGFTTALVQRSEVADDDVRFVFTAQFCISLLLTLIVYSSAGVVSAFYGRLDAIPVLQALSTLFVIQSFGQVSASLLKRRLDFRALQLAQVVSYLVAYVGVGITLALLGLGVWSLAAAALVQGAMSSMMLFRAAPHSVLPLGRSHERGYAGFGLKVMGSNLANFTINNVDSVVIGRAFGMADLGLYNRSSQLLMTPMNAVMSNLMSVLMPAYAKGQHDLASVRRAYLASITLAALVCIPPLAAAIAVPQTIVLGLYGQAWIEAAALIAPLALGTIATALLALGGPVLVGTGRPGLEFRAQIVAAITMVIAMLWAGTQSLSVLVWVIPVVYWLRFGLVTQTASTVCGARWREIAVALVGPVAVALVTALATAAADAALAGLSLSGTFLLVGDIACGTIVYGLATYGFAGLLSTPEVRWLMQRGRSRLPRVLVVRFGGSV